MNLLADWQHGVRRLMAGQAAITAMGAILYALMTDVWAALSSAYGGICVLAMSWWFARRLWFISEIAPLDLISGARALYFALALKLGVSITLLFFGLVLLRLDAIPLVVGFLAAQLVTVLVPRPKSRSIKSFGDTAE